MMKLTTKLRMPVAISSRRPSEYAERTVTLVPRQHLPPSHDDIVENLESQICALLAPRQPPHCAGKLTLCLGVLRILQDLVD
jgi:hypothetical protein